MSVVAGAAFECCRVSVVAGAAFECALLKPYVVCVRVGRLWVDTGARARGMRCSVVVVVAGWLLLHFRETGVHEAPLV